jgi:hypothetical protein
VKSRIVEVNIVYDGAEFLAFSEDSTIGRVVADALLHAPRQTIEEVYHHLLEVCSQANIGTLLLQFIHEDGDGEHIETRLDYTEQGIGWAAVVDQKQPPDIRPEAKESYYGTSGNRTFEAFMMGILSVIEMNGPLSSLELEINNDDTDEQHLVA